MISRTKLTILAGAVLLAGSAGSARADYNFTFDTVGSNTLTTSPSDQSTQLPGTYGNIAIYMDKVIGGTCATTLNCVTVQGLDSLGNAGLGAGYGVAVAQKYTGDGHVVGPGGVSTTLGNTTNAANNAVSPGSYDNYLSNVATLADGTSPSQLSQGILITFSHGVSLTGTFSFDFQIFPDGSCPSVGSCTAIPDLIVSTNGTTPYSHTFLGVAPGTLANGGSTHSPLSGGTSTELAPQLIGTSGNITLTNATTLKFMDWPAAIGIDNLKLVTATPEPMGQVFLLAGLGLVAVVGKRLRRTLAKSSPEA